MDTAGPIPFHARSDDPSAFDLAEVDTAIELVRCGAATRVRLSNLRQPGAIAAVALARAQTAGVTFAFDPTSDPPVLTFGVTS